MEVSLRDLLIILSVCALLYHFLSVAVSKWVYSRTQFWTCYLILVCDGIWCNVTRMIERDTRSLVWACCNNVVHQTVIWVWLVWDGGSNSNSKCDLPKGTWTKLLKLNYKKIQLNSLSWTELKKKLFWLN